MCSPHFGKKRLLKQILGGRTIKVVHCKTSTRLSNLPSAEILNFKKHREDSILCRTCILIHDRHANLGRPEGGEGDHNTNAVKRTRECGGAYVFSRKAEATRNTICSSDTQNGAEKSQEGARDPLKQRSRSALTEGAENRKMTTAFVWRSGT